MVKIDGRIVGVLVTFVGLFVSLAFSPNVYAIPSNFFNVSELYVVDPAENDITIWNAGASITLLQSNNTMVDVGVSGNGYKFIYSTPSSSGNNREVRVNGSNGINANAYTHIQFWGRANITTNGQMKIRLNNSKTYGNYLPVSLTTQWQRFEISISSETKNALTGILLYPNYSYASGAPKYEFYLKDVELINKNSARMRYVEDMIQSMQSYAIYYNSSRSSNHFRSIDSNCTISISTDKCDVSKQEPLYAWTFMSKNDPYNIVRNNNTYVYMSVMGTDYALDHYNNNTGRVYLYDDNSVPSYPRTVFILDSLMNMINFTNDLIGDNHYFNDIGNTTDCADNSTSSNLASTSCGLVFYYNNTIQEGTDGGVTYRNISKGTGSGDYVYMYWDIDSRFNSRSNIYTEDLNNDTYLDFPVELSIRYLDDFGINLTLTARDYGSGAGTGYAQITDDYLIGTNSNTWKVYRTTINVTNMSYAGSFSMRFEPSNTSYNYEIPVDWISINASRKDYYLDKVNSFLYIDSVGWNFTTRYQGATNQILQALLIARKYADLRNDTTIYNDTSYRYSSRADQAITTILSYVPSGFLEESSYEPTVRLGTSSFVGVDNTYQMASVQLLAKYYTLNRSSLLQGYLNSSVYNMTYLFNNGTYDWRLTGDFSSRIGSNGQIYTTWLPVTTYIMAQDGNSYAGRLTNATNSVYTINNTTGNGIRHIVDKYVYYVDSYDASTALPNEGGGRYLVYFNDVYSTCFRTAKYHSCISYKNALPSAEIGNICLNQRNECLTSVKQPYRYQQAGIGAVTSLVSVNETIMDASSISPDAHSRLAWREETTPSTQNWMRKDFISIPNNDTLGDKCALEIRLNNPFPNDANYNNTIEFILNNQSIGSISNLNVTNAEGEYKWYTINDDCNLLKQRLVLDNNENNTNNLTWHINSTGKFAVLFAVDDTTAKTLQLSAGSTDNGVTWNYDSVSPFYGWGSCPTCPKDGEFKVRFLTGNKTLDLVSSVWDINATQEVISSTYPYILSYTGKLSSRYNTKSSQTFNITYTLHDAYVKVQVSSSGRFSVNNSMISPSSIANMGTLNGYNWTNLNGHTWLFLGGNNVSVVDSNDTMTWGITDTLIMTNVSSATYWLLMNNVSHVNLTESGLASIYDTSDMLIDNSVPIIFHDNDLAEVFLNSTENYTSVNLIVKSTSLNNISSGVFKFKPKDGVWTTISTSGVSYNGGMIFNMSGIALNTTSGGALLSSNYNTISANDCIEGTTWTVQNVTCRKSNQVISGVTNHFISNKDMLLKNTTIIGDKVYTSTSGRLVLDENSQYVMS